MDRNEAIGWLEGHGYSVAQDYLADEMRNADEQEVRNALERINRHIEAGYALGLCDQEIIIHDSLWRLLLDEFDAGVVEVAKEIYGFMKKTLHPLKPGERKRGMEEMTELARYLLQLPDERLPYGKKLEEGELNFEYLIQFGLWEDMDEKREMRLWLKK